MGFDKEASCSSHGLTIPREVEEAMDPNAATPLLSHSPSHHLSSVPKTFANVFIAIVGAGVLGLPYTFKRTGWLAGILMLVAVAALTWHCLMLLVKTRRRLESDQSFSKITSFGDLGFAVSGPVGRLAVDTMIILSQAGFCVSYLIFIANTFAHMFNSPSPNPNPNPNPSSTSVLASSLHIAPKALYVWAMFPFQLGLNSIKTLTHLAPLSIFADVVDIAAMGVVVVEDVAIYLKELPLIEAFRGGMSVLFYGLGVAVYSFEGVGMVLPLEAETADKSKFGKILALCMFLITIMYGLFGVLGYFAFGEDTRDIITTNLGSGLVTNIVQISLCINLFVSFPIMMNPVHEVVERRFAGKTYSLWMRWVVVLGVVLVALFVPNFTDFLSLVGSSVCCVLGLVLPALFHIKVFKGEMGLGMLGLDVFIVVVGVVMTITGTYTSLMEIISPTT